MVCEKVPEILAAMTKSCMSPTEIAKASGVSVNIVYRIRKGYMVKMDRFGKVCKTLGLDPAEVMDFERMDRNDNNRRVCS